MEEKVFKSIFKDNKTPKVWADLLKLYMPKYGITTKMRISAFLSQCGHESGGFSKLTENLNYSRDGLLKVFPRYFPTVELATQYARKPESIANKVYANRLGNGTEKSGDGWKYRGRGVIQLTGKDNYTAFAKWLGDSQILINPDVVSTPKYSILSAMWFWTTNNLNKVADTGDVKIMTKRINGGYNGLEHRLALYNSILGKL